MKTQLVQAIRSLLLHRVLFSGLLAALALAGVIGGSIWLILVSSAPVLHREVSRKPGEKEPQAVRMVLTRLMAQQLSPATAPVRIEAATARSLEGWSRLALEGVEARASEISGSLLPGASGESSFSAFLRADRGVVDLKQGNLVLSGDVHAQRSDGVSIRSKRLEYEAARDEIRFVTAEIRSPKVTNVAGVIVTDSRLNRIRFAKSHPVKHPFFRKYSEH